MATNWLNGLTGIDTVLNNAGTPVNQRDSIRAGTNVEAVDDGTSTVLNVNIPAFDPSIAYTWAGIHTFQSSAIFNGTTTINGPLNLDSDVIGAAEIDLTAAYPWSGNHTFAANANFTGTISLPFDSVTPSMLDENGVFTWTNTHNFNGQADHNDLVRLQSEVQFNGVTSSSASGTFSTFSLGSDTNFLRLTGAGALTIYGFSGQGPGRMVWIVNTATTRAVTLAHDSATTASVVNRIECPDDVDFILGPNRGVAMVYDDVLDKWRLIASGGAAGDVSDTDDVTWTGDHVFEGDVAEESQQLFATVGTLNDLALDPGTTTLRFTGSGAVTLTGVVPNRDGQKLRIMNATGSTLTIEDNYVGSVAANRIRTGTGATTRTLVNGTFGELWYDSISLRWRLDKSWT